MKDKFFKAAPATKIAGIEKGMVINMKTRRIGTLTLGTSLVIFGLLFIIRIFVPNFDYIFIARCWPIILIFLGSEVLASCFHSKDKEEHIKYDFAAVFIIIILAFFAMGMASAEFYMDNYIGYWGIGY